MCTLIGVLVVSFHLFDSWLVGGVCWPFFVFWFLLVVGSLFFEGLVVEIKR